MTTTTAPDPVDTETKGFTSYLEERNTLLTSIDDIYTEYRDYNFNKKLYINFLFDKISIYRDKINSVSNTNLYSVANYDSMVAKEMTIARCLVETKRNNSNDECEYCGKVKISKNECASSQVHKKSNVPYYPHYPYYNRWCFKIDNNNNISNISNDNITYVIYLEYNGKPYTEYKTYPNDNTTLSSILYDLNNMIKNTETKITADIFFMHPKIYDPRQTTYYIYATDDQITGFIKFGDGSDEPSSQYNSTVLDYILCPKHCCITDPLSRTVGLDNSTFSLVYINLDMTHINDLEVSISNCIIKSYFNIELDSDNKPLPTPLSTIYKGYEDILNEFITNIKPNDDFSKGTLLDTHNKNMFINATINVVRAILRTICNIMDDSSFLMIIEDEILKYNSSIPEINMP